MNCQHEGGYTKSMLDDCTLEFLRVRNCHRHTFFDNEFSDDDVDDDQENVLDKHYYKSLQKQKAFEFNNIENSHFFKWNEMKSLRDERFSREDKIMTLCKYKALWPIYKYTLEK